MGAMQNKEAIMLNRPITRRTAVRGAAVLAATTALSVRPTWAADKTVTVGINLSLTGADAESAKRIENGALMAFDEVNAKGGVNGYKIVVTPYDDGSATAGQYDPAQAATNARKMVSNKATVAAIGPQMSGAGKGADPESGQPGDHHPEFHQSRHHRPEIRRPVPARGQGDLLPHRRHRRVPGALYGQLLRRRAEGEDRLHPGR
jgi:hypothetical protein